MKYVNQPGKAFGLCLCEMQTLEEESAPYEKPFYLFGKE